MFPIILVIGDARASFEIVDSPSPSRASAPSNQSVMAFIISGAVAALLFVLIVILFVRRQRLQNKQVTALNSGFQGLPYGNPTLTSGSRTGQHYGINEPNLYDEIYDTTDVDFADTDLDLQLYDNTSNDSPDAVYDTTTEPQQRRETLFERPIYDVPSDGTRQRAATVFEKPAYDMANDGRLLNSAVEPNDYDIASSELFYGDFSAAKPVDESLDFQHPVESQPYYFGKISRKDAESLLREHRARYTDVDTYPAFFLVRDASSGGYALSIIYRSGVVHHTLSASNKGFWQVNNKSTTFTDAVELLSQMQNEVVPPLTRPIGLAIEVMA